MRPTNSYPPEQRAFVEETKRHIRQVQELLAQASDNLGRRRLRHDSSKLEEPEISGFMAMAEELKLSETDYGSPEYRENLRKYKDSTIASHYAANDHHPEHTVAGIAGMSLLSLIEMLCDWKAATTRMKGGGDLRQSILLNRERFGYDDTLASVLLNTADELGMIEETNEHPATPDDHGPERRAHGPVGAGLLTRPAWPGGDRTHRGLPGDSP